LAIPPLYWMIECAGCGARPIVFETFLVFVGLSIRMLPSDPGTTQRHSMSAIPARRECVQPMKTIGSIGYVDDEKMWLYEPHVPVTMTKPQADEWRHLIEVAGLQRRWRKSHP
jgi:hypothetical protein